MSVHKKFQPNRSSCLAGYSELAPMAVWALLDGGFADPSLLLSYLYTNVLFYYIDRMVSRWITNHFFKNERYTE